jgi:hypothetical protein
MDTTARIRIRWVNQLVLVSRDTLLYSSWVKPDSLSMLLDRKPSVIIDFNVLSLLDLHLTFYSSPVLDTHLNDFEGVLD